MSVLNKQQQEAVDYHEGHLLIVAGPGTGKTHTLTHRIAKTISFLKQQQKALAITFTNKAACEMKERLQKMPNALNQRIFVGTFHQFCIVLLKQYYREAKVCEGFKVFNPYDLDVYLKELWTGLSKKERLRRLDEISRWKGTFDTDTEPPDFYRDYKDILNDKQGLDYDDLLCSVARLLQNSLQVREEVQAKYLDVFVDEYQDVNALQCTLLKLLIGENNTITAIGDPHQSIYGFRGSQVAFFQNFENDFKGARRLVLSENYRSFANLLKASSQVIHPGESENSDMLTAHKKGEGRLITHSAITEKGEAEYVVHQIEKLIGGTSMFSQDSGRVEADMDAEISFSDVAVLYRLNSQRHALKVALDRSGIPYSVSEPSYEDDDVICPFFGDDMLKNYNVEGVSLMSIHAAKGLEFSTVFVVGCEASLLPLSIGNLSSDLEEERRLFYVGMTRAKWSLYLVSSECRFLFGQKLKNVPSPFLDDIDSDLKFHEARVVSKKVKKKQKKDEQMSLF